MTYEQGATQTQLWPEPPLEEGTARAGGRRTGREQLRKSVLYFCYVCADRKIAGYFNIHADRNARPSVAGATSRGGDGPGCGGAGEGFRGGGGGSEGGPEAFSFAFLASFFARRRTSFPSVMRLARYSQSASCPSIALGEPGQGDRGQDEGCRCLS